MANIDELIKFNEKKYTKYVDGLPYTYYLTNIEFNFKGDFKSWLKHYNWNDHLIYSCNLEKSNSLSLYAGDLANETFKVVNSIYLRTIDLNPNNNNIFYTSTRTASGFISIIPDEKLNNNEHIFILKPIDQIIYLQKIHKNVHFLDPSCKKFVVGYVSPQTYGYLTDVGNYIYTTSHNFGDDCTYLFANLKNFKLEAFPDLLLNGKDYSYCFRGLHQSNNCIPFYYSELKDKLKFDNNPTTMFAMFNDNDVIYGDVDMSNLIGTSIGVGGIRLLFKNCPNITSVNLCNFVGRKTMYLNEVFYGCTNLKYIDLSSFETTETYADGFITNCPNLINIKCKQSLYDALKKSYSEDFLNKIIFTIV